MPRKQAAAAREQFLFRDRHDAGAQLAGRLAAMDLHNPLILALPRGGVPVAIEIAQALKAPLDLLLVRKIGLPWQPELAVGAVLNGNEPHTVINEQIARAAHLDEADIVRIARTQLEEVAHRRRIWLSDREHVPVTGRTAILVDDGAATGASMRVALDAVKMQNAAQIILAVPVAADIVANSLREACDQLVVLAAPRDFVSVGMYYRDFRQLQDDEVRALLNRAWSILPAD